MPQITAHLPENPKAVRDRVKRYCVVGSQDEPSVPCHGIHDPPIRPVANSFAKVVYCGAAFLPFCLFCRVSSAAAASPTPPTKASKTKGNGNEPSKVPPDQPASQPTAAFNCIKVVRQWKRRRRRLGQRDRLGVRRVALSGDGSSSGRGKAKSLGASH